MTCRRCKATYDPAQHKACPNCGAPRPRLRPTFLKTSTIMISAGGSEGVYRSLDDVPAPLRNQLIESTSGQNAATILIADRKGREEIARAVRRMPGAQEGLGARLPGAAGRAGLTVPRWLRLGAAGIVLAMAALVLWVLVGRP
jgi:hypothetical protein